MEANSSLNYKAKSNIKYLSLYTGFVHLLFAINFIDYSTLPV